MLGLGVEPRVIGSESLLVNHCAKQPPRMKRSHKHAEIIKWHAKGKLPVGSYRRDLSKGRSSSCWRTRVGGAVRLEIEA